jgi:hypothetical protein
MNPEDFSRFFDENFTDQSQDAPQSPLRVCFPVALIEQLRASLVATSRLFVAELKRLAIDSEAEESFDLFGFLGDEDGRLADE